MDKQTIDQLIRALARSIGNKRYLDDLEKLFSRLELTPQERQALRYLSQDLERLGSNSPGRCQVCGSPK